MALFSTFWACSLIGAYSFARDSVFLLPRRGYMYPTEGNLSPYSAECVEGEFCEVHECAQSSLACSSVFTPQCAGGLSSAGSRVFSSPIAGSTSSWVRLAVERSAPERSAPERFAPERSASRRSAPVRSAPVRFAPMRSALNRFALTGFALSRSALISSASERSALTRCASERSVLGRSALERAASVRLASVRSAPVRFASERFVPERLAPERFASERFLPERSALVRFGSIRGPSPSTSSELLLQRSWLLGSPLFWDALLPLFILPTTSVGETKPATLCSFTLFIVLRGKKRNSQKFAVAISSAFPRSYAYRGGGEPHLALRPVSIDVFVSR